MSLKTTTTSVRFLSTLYILLFLPLTFAWGNLTHRTIAILASKYFTPAARRYSDSLLGGEAIDSAAVWADTYKFLPEGHHTSSWHFVDAQDDPPHSCNVNYSRDCREQRPCIITAILNMTEVLNRYSSTEEDRRVAFKFILHLLGDLHCPLHAEGLLRGGNDLPVLYEGQHTNLHFVWDVLIPQSLTGGWGLEERLTAAKWAQNLYGNRTAMGKADPDICLRTETSSAWQFSLSRPYKMVNAEKEIAEWAGEANFWVCKVVLNGGIEGIRGRELSEEYLAKAIPVVNMLVTKAGWRLAAWINELAIGREEKIRAELK